MEILHIRRNHIDKSIQLKNTLQGYFHSYFTILTKKEGWPKATLRYIRTLYFEY